MINAARADILLVAFGVPHQERWIQEWFARLNSQLVIGVGGLFDFYSGRIKRAPRWLRDVGLEWCFRLVMEPRRMFKRYIIGNPLFLKRVKGLRKAADYLNNLIDEAKKNRRSRIIDLNRDHYLHKKHAELLDLFPLLAEHCALNQIPLCFHWKDHALAQKCSDIFQKVYPQVILSAEVNVNFNQFLVIIADEESKLIDNLISMPDIIALCFIDKRFSHELQFLSITP
jgi:hypothetical protein